MRFCFQVRGMHVCTQQVRPMQGPSPRLPAGEHQRLEGLHLEESPVDVVDDLHVPRQQLFHERHRPLLQRLRQHCVVGEGEHLQTQQIQRLMQFSWPPTKSDEAACNARAAALLLQTTCVSDSLCSFVSGLFLSCCMAAQCQGAVGKHWRMGRAWGVMQAFVTDLAGHVPGLGPAQPVLVHEQPHELRDPDGRVRVVQLEGDLLRELVEARVRLLVPPHHVLAPTTLSARRLRCETVPITAVRRVPWSGIQR